MDESDCRVRDVATDDGRLGGIELISVTGVIGSRRGGRVTGIGIVACVIVFFAGSKVSIGIAAGFKAKFLFLQMQKRLWMASKPECMLCDKV